MRNVERIAERVMGAAILVYIWTGIAIAAMTFPDSPLYSTTGAWIAGVPFAIATGTMFTALTVMVGLLVFKK